MQFTEFSVRNYLFFAGGKYLLPGINGSSKTNIPSAVSKYGDIVIAQLPPFVRYMTKHNSIWSKALIMPLTIWNCVLSCQ